jgi:hypothetical protein
VLGGFVEALLRRDFQLVDKTVDAAEKILMLEDDVMTTIEKDRVHDQIISR